MIVDVIFGWDWGTPAILQQNPNKKHPWKNWIKTWDWQTPPPPPQLGQNPKFFQKSDLKAPLSVHLAIFNLQQYMYLVFI